MCIHDSKRGIEQEDLQRQWREKVVELQSIDDVLQSLRMELRQFELRRASVAEAEASLRQQLDSNKAVPSHAGEVLEAVMPGNTITRVESARLGSHAPDGDELLQMCASITDACERNGSAAHVKKHVIAHDDPVVFNLDDEESEQPTGPSPVHDWETGLDVLNRRPSTCDRAAVMKHRMALASLKQGTSATTSGTGSGSRSKEVQQKTVWHMIGRTVSMF